MALVVMNRKLKYVLYFLFGLALIANIMKLLAPLLHTWQIPIYGLYNEFMLEIFIGAAIWLLYQKTPVWLAVGLSIIGLVWFFTPIKMHTSRLLDFGIPSAMLITGLTALEFHRKVNVPEVLVLLGNASYSLYILHTPVISAVLKNINIQYATNKLVLLLMVVIVMILAVFSYLYIEKPILRWLKNYKQKPVEQKI
jgi:peptidoglycan/LPS O-acetylase OafA/YrhL